MPTRAGTPQALLERWLEAQNRQDFVAYQALHAERFEAPLVHFVRRTATLEGGASAT